MPTRPAVKPDDYPDDAGVTARVMRRWTRAVRIHLLAKYAPRATGPAKPRQ